MTAALRAVDAELGPRLGAFLGRRLGLEPPRACDPALLEELAAAGSRAIAGAPRSALTDLARSLAAAGEDDRGRLALELGDRALTLLLEHRPLTRALTVHSLVGTRRLGLEPLLDRRVIGGALLSGCLFLALLGASSVFWGPPAFRLLRDRLRDPAVVEAVQRSRRAVTEEERLLTQLLTSLERPPPAALVDARASREAAQAALEQNDWARAREALLAAERALQRALTAVTAEEARQASEARQTWRRLAGTYGWQRIPEAQRAQDHVVTAEALRTDRPRDAALAFRTARLLFAAAPLAADREPPLLHLTRPDDGVATLASRVTIEGRVREPHLTSLTLDGERLTPGLPDELGWRAFRTHLRLTAIGPRRCVLEAIDSAGRTQRLARTVTRKARALLVALDAPAEGVVHGAGPLRIRGRVADPAQVSSLSVTVNGARAALDEAGAFTHTLPAPPEGPLTLEVVAAGTFARGATQRALLVDRTPPVLTIVGGLPPAGPVWEEALSLTVRVRDASPYVTLRFGKRTERLVPKSDAVIKVPLAEGSNTIELTATDAAGNAAAPITRTVVRRSDPPLLKPYRIGVKRYRITRRLTIGRRATLRLSPGARLEFTQAGSLRVLGKLETRGGRRDRVELSGEGWGGIEVAPGGRASLFWTAVQGARAPVGAGVRVAAGGSLELRQSLISDCKASKMAGALDIAGALIADDVLFVDNHGGKEGGAIVVSGRGQARIRDCTFHRNQADNYGGALVVLGDAQGGPDVRCRKSLFKENTSRLGGAIQVGRAGRLTLTDCQFESNLAAERGGAIYATGHPGPGQTAVLVMKGGALRGNGAKVEGGAIGLNVYSQAEFTDVTVARNTCRGNGGGLIVVGAKDQPTVVTLTRVKLIGNTCAGDGGAANLNRFTAARLDGCRIEKNRGVFGGGVAAIGLVEAPSKLDLVKCVFRANTGASEARGHDLRVGEHVLFDETTLGANGLTANRVSIVKPPPPPEPPKPDPPKPDEPKPDPPKPDTPK